MARLSLSLSLAMLSLKPWPGLVLLSLAMGFSEAWPGLVSLSLAVLYRMARLNALPHRCLFFCSRTALLFIPAPFYYFMFIILSGKHR